MDSDPLINQVIAERFRIIKPLGEGQMARVYAAEQLSMRRTVALKLLHAHLLVEATAVARFRREVEAVSLLKSPHTIEFYDFGQTEDGALFIAMEYIDGETLRARLKRDRAIPPAEVVSIVRQVGKSLGEAHAAGIIHRDLKPENINFSQAPTPLSPFVKVLDFGLAKLQEPTSSDVSITGKHMTVGTPAYLAPEMAMQAKEPDWRSDIYSLAVITYEMLVGQRPYTGENALAMLMAHIRNPIPSATQRMPGLPRDVDDFFQMALAKDQHHRFSNLESFANALEGSLSAVL